MSGTSKPRACESPFATTAVDRIHEEATADVRRAASLIGSGLDPLGV